MKIIDFHTHVFADEIAGAAIESLRPALDANNITNAVDGTVTGLEESMDGCGVTQSVYLPLATKSTQTGMLIEWAAALQQRNPRFLCAGTLHPNNTDYRQLVRLIKDKGLVGVKMHPVFQNFSVLDPKMLDVFRACGEVGLPVILHAGLDIVDRPDADGTPASLARMLDLCPDTTFVAAHMGGNRLWDEVEEHLVGSRIYIDTSLACLLMDPAQFARIIRDHGTDKVLFGSDSPWCAQQQSIDYLRACGFTEKEEQRIFSKNALRLLGMLG